MIVVPGQVIGQKVVEFFPDPGKGLMGRLIQGFQLEQWLHGRDHENGIARGEHGVTAGVGVDAAGPLVETRRTLTGYYLQDRRSRITYSVPRTKHAIRRPTSFPVM